MHHALLSSSTCRPRLLAASLLALALSAGMLLIATPGSQAAPRAVLGELFSADG